MSLFHKTRTDGETHDGQGEERKGFIDVIKYNGEADELVWKFPYENISTAAQLVVNQSQEAIFIKGGAVCDLFGPGTKTLSANNIPLLQKLVNLPFGGKTPFTAEVWYVSKTVRRNLKFGTPVPVDLLDPLYNVPVPVRAFGEFGVQVADSSAFLGQMVGTLHLFTTGDIIEQFKSLVARKLSTCISKFIVRQKVTVVEIGAYLDEVSNLVREAIAEEFARYGLQVTNLDVASINFDKEDPNVQKILDSQSEAAKRRMEGYSYQQERQFDVMQGAAQNEGSAGQMMGAGMGMGMGFGLGGMFGQQMGNMAGVLNPQAPPPPPASYHVLINNARQGPHDASTLQQMAREGQVTRQTLVWQAGMARWESAGERADLQPLFEAVPPPPPVVNP
ncbi:MAG: SPFH domain-containing protein [Odoribacteraceae bacterium]|jgi:membrane protease subunit (stomatin/prohibitin family)|nr:SPFH domain-containing protein [Odoribacteraceae bacterium]